MTQERMNGMSAAERIAELEAENLALRESRDQTRSWSPVFVIDAADPYRYEYDD